MPLTSIALTDHVATITIDPPVGGYDRAFLDAVGAAAGEVAANGDVRAVILGKKDIFISWRNRERGEAAQQFAIRDARTVRAEIAEAGAVTLARDGQFVGVDDLQTDFSGEARRSDGPRGRRFGTGTGLGHATGTEPASSGSRAKQTESRCAWHDAELCTTLLSKRKRVLEP